MQNSLDTSSGGGTQAVTQNPQSATSDNSLSGNQGNLQSSSVNLLNGTNGVTLNPTSLPTVPLNSSTTTSPSSLVTTPPKHHSVNAILLAIVIVIFVAAIAIFWKTTLAAKNTTE